MCVYIFISLFNKCMMVPSISPFPVLLKCGVVRSSPPHSGPLLLSYCLRAAGKGGAVFTKLNFVQVVTLFFPYCLLPTWSVFVSGFVHLLSGRGVTETFGASGSDIKWFRHSSKKVH